MIEKNEKPDKKQGSQSDCRQQQATNELNEKQQVSEQLLRRIPKVLVN